MSANLPAGRELDEMVGRALGAKPRLIYFASNDGGMSCVLARDTRESLQFWLEGQQRKGYFAGYEICTIEIWPDYSTDIAAAWQVVEKLGFDLIKVDEGWMVGDGRRGYSDDTGRVEEDLINFAIAETAPHAIALAALKASEAR